LNNPKHSTTHRYFSDGLFVLKDKKSLASSSPASSFVRFPDMEEAFYVLQ